MNDQLRFDFFEPDGTWVTAFAGTFPAAGVYTWTLPLGDCPTGYYVPRDGLFQIGLYGTTTSFSWISETDSAELGTEGIAYLGDHFHPQGDVEPDMRIVGAFELGRRQQAVLRDSFRHGHGAKSISHPG